MMDEKLQKEESVQAVAALAAMRGVRHDKSDTSLWLQKLQPHNHSGLVLEAARRFCEVDEYQDVPVTLSTFLREVKRIRNERIKAREGSLPEPPHGLSDEEYRKWLTVRNEGAVRGFSAEEIDARARMELRLPPRGPLSARRAPVLMPPSPPRS